MRKLLLVVALAIAAPAFAQAPPNKSEVVRKLFATGAYDLHTDHGQAAFVDAVVSTLNGLDGRWVHLKKKPGQSQLHGHAEDAVLYLADEDGKSTAVDFIGGAGGPNPQPAWNLDEPRYSRSDGLEPFLHATPPKPCPVCPPVVTIPPYAGDEVFDQVGAALFADYAAAGQAPNIGMGRWFGRTIYDWIAGNTRTLQESIEKHRREWREILGLPR